MSGETESLSERVLIQVLLASLKKGTIVVIVVAGVLFGKQNANEAAPLVSPLGMGTVRALLTALVAAMWA